MQAAAGRERIYVLPPALTLVAICAFGVFVIRDYQDQGSQKVGLARLGGAATGGDASLPSTGDTGSAAPQGSTGASSGSAAGPPAGAAARPAPRPAWRPLGPTPHGPRRAHPRRAR